MSKRPYFSDSFEHFFSIFFKKKKRFQQILNPPLNFLFKVGTNGVKNFGVAEIDHPAQGGTQIRIPDWGLVSYKDYVRLVYYTKDLLKSFTYAIMEIHGVGN